MRVALLGPVAWRTPPDHYGPWEQVTGLLAEGLITRGVDVTLFATLDSVTSAALDGVCRRGYADDPDLDGRVWGGDARVHAMARSSEFDLVHSHLDWLPLAFAEHCRAPLLTTVHGFSGPGILPAYVRARSSYVSISDADRSAELDYVATVHHGVDLTGLPFTRDAGPGLAAFGRIHPDKGTHTAIEIARRAGRPLTICGEEDCDNEITATVLDALPDRYNEATFERVLGELPPDLLSRSTGPDTLEHLRRTNAASYATTFPADTTLHQRVLWPAVPAESNGMEDARFVRFTDESGPVYRATYTAYDGRHIAARALGSGDLRRFESAPMRGPGVRNKGIALFPRTAGGRHLALCRADGETIGLTRLDGENRWQEPVPLHAPGTAGN